MRDDGGMEKCLVGRQLQNASECRIPRRDAVELVRTGNGTGNDAIGHFSYATFPGNT